MCSTQGPIRVGLSAKHNPDGSTELVGRYLDEPGEPPLPTIEWPKDFSVAGSPLEVRSGDGETVAAEGDVVVFAGGAVAEDVFSPCYIDGVYYPGT